VDFADVWKSEIERFWSKAIEPNTSSLGDGKTGALSVTLPAAD